MSTVRLFWKHTLFAALLGFVGNLQAGEVLEFPLLPEWDYVDSEETPDLTIIKFVGSGESIDGWSRLLTVINHTRKVTPPDLHAYYEQVRASREAVCPGMTQWTLIEQTADSIIYESRSTKVCPDHPAQHELVRLLKGTNHWFNISFALRDSELSYQTRKKWIELLETAEIKEEPY